MKQNWKDIARKWQSYTPPVKPSKAELYFYEQKIKKLTQKQKNLKALVLGATPEFRGLLAKYKIDTTILDNNKISVQAMTSLIKKKNPKEKVKIGNWFKIPLKPKTFDLVLSDTAQDNIKYKDFPKFFENIHKVIKPTGFWLSGHVHLEKKNYITFKTYIKMYHTNPKEFKSKQTAIGRFFQLAYEPEFYNYKTRIFNFTKVDAKVKQLVKKGQLPKPALKDLCFNIDYAQPIIPLPELISLLNKKFKILDQMQDKSHPAMIIRWSAVLKPRT